MSTLEFEESSEPGTPLPDHATLWPVRCPCDPADAQWPLEDDAPTCRVCGTRTAGDDLGIVDLDDRDLPWRKVPQRFADAVARATTDGEVISALVDGEHRLSRSGQMRLLHPGSGVAAMLVPAHTGTRALDFGTGWTMLSSALGSVGAEVAAVDWSRARLRFTRLLQRPAPRIAAHVHPAQRLPFADATFDFVFADVDEIEHALGVAAAASTLVDVLAELRRVLRPDGVAVFAVENHLRSGRRRPADGAAAKPHSIASMWDRMRAAIQPWRALELRRAGFASLRLVVPHPRRESWQWLVPEERLRAHLVRSQPTKGWRDVVKLWVRRLLAGLGGGAQLMADYYVLARRDGCSSGKPRTLSESLPELAGERPPLIRSLSDARVAIHGEDRFIKFPLSPFQQQTLVAEVRKTEAARTTGFASFMLPWSRVERWHRIPYTVFPLVTPLREQAPGDTLSALEAALDATAPRQTAPLHRTAVWQRIQSRAGARAAEDVGGQALRRALLERCGDCIVPVGPTHGDVHGGNVLLSTDGRSLLVDWNRFEVFNPALLDALYVVVKEHKRAGANLEQALVAFADGQSSDAVAERAISRLGDLTRAQGATLLLLDRIVAYSEPRRRHRPWKLAPLVDAAVPLTRRIDDWPDL